MATLLAACGPSPQEFREADPNGYQACHQAWRSLNAGGAVARQASREAVRLAAEAETFAIQAQVDDRNGGRDGAPVLADLGTMREVCERQGYDWKR